MHRVSEAEEEAEEEEAEVLMAEDVEIKEGKDSNTANKTGVAEVKVGGGKADLTTTQNASNVGSKVIWRGSVTLSSVTHVARSAISQGIADLQRAIREKNILSFFMTDTEQTEKEVALWIFCSSVISCLLWARFL